MSFIKAHLSIVFVLFAFVACDDLDSASLMGCFKYSSVVTNFVSHDVDSADPKCIGVCAANYYRHVQFEITLKRNIQMLFRLFTGTLQLVIYLVCV